MFLHHQFAKSDVPYLRGWKAEVKTLHCRQRFGRSVWAGASSRVAPAVHLFHYGYVFFFFFFFFLTCGFVLHNAPRDRPVYSVFESPNIKENKPVQAGTRFMRSVKLVN
ncbi:hypothetical protein CROQUDRAFT_457598 [Cronartium quercuum f. sp. fusiforme G11]|uniref:Transmembrane protein n=1 Tax=Cronartium quercuum f. sp. fusiforme G11 TaxID=708437 RepID=A0A9P6N626_9BASI|nr:hypothetical protein CROQUDRAFT_457598 [Cronartium quercuum f. sp. fusiforme G11]